MEQKRENQCVVAGCGLTRCVGHNKCVLHCEKNGNTQINYELFVKELKDYTTAQANKTLEEGSLTFAKNKPKIFIFDKIIFPQFFQFSDIYFNQNIDRSSSIIMNECVFISNVSIEQDCIEFFSCVFNEDISRTDVELPQNSYIFFQFCLFHKSFCLSEVSGLGSLEFKTCEFDAIFLINRSELINFEMIYLIFKSDVSITNNTIGKMQAPIIGNVSFKSNTDFSNTKFPCGLILLHSFFNLSVNFNNVALDSEKSLKVTPVESFRQIKHSLDSIGNTIEANKFFTLEMKAYERELKENGGTKSEKFLLWINRATSDYGENFVRPIIILILFNLFLTFNVFLYRNANKEVFNFHFLTCIPNFFNTFASLILPFKDLVIKGHDFLTLIISIINGVLIYQTIVALKRKTRR